MQRHVPNGTGSWGSRTPGTEWAGTQDLCNEVLHSLPALSMRGAKVGGQDGGRRVLLEDSEPSKSSMGTDILVRKLMQSISIHAERAECSHGQRRPLLLALPAVVLLPVTLLAVLSSASRSFSLNLFSSFSEVCVLNHSRLATVMPVSSTSLGMYRFKSM